MHRGRALAHHLHLDLKGRRAQRVERERHLLRLIRGATTGSSSRSSGSSTKAATQPKPAPGSSSNRYMKHTESSVSRATALSHTRSMRKLAALAASVEASRSPSALHTHDFDTTATTTTSAGAASTFSATTTSTTSSTANVATGETLHTPACRGVNAQYLLTACKHGTGQAGANVMLTTQGVTSLLRSRMDESLTAQAAQQELAQLKQTTVALLRSYVAQSSTNTAR